MRGVGGAGVGSAAILDQVPRLRGIPATLIHGRRDVSGPSVVPWRLHRAWPGSELIIVERDGHGGQDMVDAWRSANNRHGARLSAECAARLGRAR